MQRLKFENKTRSSAVRLPNLRINWVIVWNRYVVILRKFSSLAVQEIVILTTSRAAGDENYIKMTFQLQWYLLKLPGPFLKRMADVLLAIFQIVFKENIRYFF